MFDLSIVVTCKGRLEHLKQSLPNMLSQFNANFQVVVVDYDCPSKTNEYCEGLNNERILSVKVKDKPNFNLSHARNCGAVSTDSKFLAFVDADVFLNENFCSESLRILLDGDAELALFPYDTKTKHRKLSGTCVVSSQIFHTVKGYDESLQGWGCEEKDFYARCKNVGVKIAFLTHDLVDDTIRHHNSDRVQFYDEKDRHASNRVNRAKTANSKQNVNATGYGIF